ncbi:hypothetical protein [Clostridium brassicae]|uniref:Uncharacterized protein n=1 Tax=Clostridium brassicae TaxID=2999072 RepID=A0ABT4DA04_9CLOT|nr:hypothetical protein [Clostridium brassicae]MCY6957859.1 hypothetical protein [Clostridium brassicae]
MKYIIIFLLYIYGMTGIFISIKLFKNTIGKILGGVYFGLFWLPILISEIIKRRMEV